MKNGIFLAALMILTFSVAQAQIKPDVEKIKANTRIKQAPSKTALPPPPAPVNKTTTSTETLVYTFTSVRVKIRTGSDNKEFPSNVSVSVRTKNTRDGIGVPFSQFSLSNEMRINSETEFGLERHTQYQVLECTTDGNFAPLTAVIKK